MKKLFFITVIMATLALSGCLRHCEGFPPQMQQTYFPYTGPALYVKLEGKINHTNHELKIELFYRGMRENDYDGMWIPEYNNRYYPYVYVQKDTIVEGWAGFPYYWYSLINGVDGGAICSLLDTLYFAYYENYPGHTIDTLVVVKDRGLAGFSTSDGRKYVLTE